MRSQIAKMRSQYCWGADTDNASSSYHAC